MSISFADHRHPKRAKLIFSNFSRLGVPSIYLKAPPEHVRGNDILPFPSSSATQNIPSDTLRYVSSMISIRRTQLAPNGWTVIHNTATSEFSPLSPLFALFGELTSVALIYSSVCAQRLITDICRYLDRTGEYRAHSLAQEDGPCWDRRPLCSIINFRVSAASQ